MGIRLDRPKFTRNALPGNMSQDWGPKEIGGSLLKRWGVWFNSTIHGKPYHLPCGGYYSYPPPLSTAWLSPARALGCGVQSSNERNPQTLVGHGAYVPWGPNARVHLGVIPYVAEVKSLWSVTGGLHTRYTEGCDNGWQAFTRAPNPKSLRVLGGGLNSSLPR